MSVATLSRDDLARCAFAPDFFDANPAMADLRAEISACSAAYAADAASRTCRCGGDPRLILGCLESLLTRLENLRQENPEAIAQFIAYVGAKREAAVQVVKIYYRGTAQTPLRKIRLP